MDKTSLTTLVDVDANLLHTDLSADIEHHLQVASSVGVKQFVVPGSTVDDSRGALELSQQKPNVVFPTAGVHPYHVEGCGLLEDAMANIASLAALEQVRCVGECGLDYSEGFPSAELQLPWFEKQVEIACKLKKPLFLHERAAFGDFSEVGKSPEPQPRLWSCCDTTPCMGCLRVWYIVLRETRRSLLRTLIWASSSAWPGLSVGKRVGLH
eukprot:g2011.t2